MLIRTLKIFFLACLAIGGLFFLARLIPASSIEISSSSDSGKTAIDQKTKISPTGQDENILLLGRAGPGYSGGELTDTIIIAHLAADQQKAVLISLPRDLLVRIPGQETLTKINALYISAGLDKLKEKIKGITNLTIDHYFIVDLVAVKEMIDLTDGLNVYVPQDINDPYFPGPNYSYQNFTLKAGWRYLDGTTALKYIRTRYTSPNGDFDRMARQQQIIQLLKQKVLALNPLWDFPTYLKMFNSLNNHLETDLSFLEMKSFYDLAQKIGPDQIQSLVLDKKETELLTSGPFLLGGQLASVAYPKIGLEDYSIIQTYLRNFISL